jgi:beta-glucanase (GH16 family)
MKLTVKDFLTKLFLDTKSIYRNLTKTTQPGKDFNFPGGYKLVFMDLFKGTWERQWKNYFDITQPYHPGALHQWYDVTRVSTDQRGLVLESKKISRYFPELYKSIPNAVGSIQTKQSWKYGIFKFNAAMPVGKWLWPAIWLTGLNTWPPEIDIVECWSENSEVCKKPTTNIHISMDGKHSQYPSFGHIIPNTGFYEVLLHWEKDFVKIYYNNYLVYQITDKKVLDKINDEQRVVFTAGTDDKGRFKGDNKSPLIIKSVEIYQKQ